jgi:hypothetical protein
MVMTGEPTVQWASPSPLWTELVQGTSGTVDQAFLAPAILRFASDSFMDEFMGLLNTTPGRLGERRVMPETWREPIPLPAPLPALPLPTPGRPHSVVRSGIFGAVSTAPALTGTANSPLKLYQAAHLRFYLVCACLVCRVPGLPDRMLNIPAQEQVGFVMRRLQPHVAGTIPDTHDPGSYDEFAFVSVPQGTVWQQVGDDSAIMPGEELIPLFPVTFSGEDGRKRRLLSGLIPVGKREAYLGAPLVTSSASTGNQPAPPTPPLGGLRETLLNMQVIQPWANLDQLEQLKKKQPDQIPSLQDQIQVASWYILLDFALYLQKYLPNVWQAIKGQQGNVLTNQEQALFNILVNTVSSDTGVSLRQALNDITAWQDKLENETESYTEDPNPTNWPDFKFSLRDANVFPLVQELAQEINEPSSATSYVPTTLETLVIAALPAQAPEASLPPPPLVQTVPNRSDSAWFVIRCVFERPNCGPLKPTVMSAPTVVFKLAAFFDPDAPARPIRISLPLDTSFAGLRKFNKNVAFVIPDTLHKQMARVTDLKSTMDGKLGSGQGIDIGLICSFSIPIITICAMIVLMIFIMLLNIVFFWIPLLKICFPIPKVKE